MSSLSFRERTVQFGRADHLNGILTLPKGLDGKPFACLLIINSGIVHRIGVSRLHVSMARQLSNHGIASLRFDLSGVGDSDTPPGLDSIQAIVDEDLRDAIHFTKEQFGDSPLVGAGLCSGAYDWIRSVGRNEGLWGAILLDLFSDYITSNHVFRHYVKRITNVASWNNALSDPKGKLMAMKSRFSSVQNSENQKTDLDDVEVGVRPILSQNELGAIINGAINDRINLFFIYSDGLEDIYNYHNQFADVFPEQVKSPHIDWDYIAGSNHTFEKEAHRQRLLASIVGWLKNRGLIT